MRPWARFLLAAAISGLVPGTAAGWFSTGHMITAQIAYDQLEPDVRREVDRLIGVLADLEPKIGNFVAAATWMDQIKSYGLHVFDGWHYYDAPINAGGLGRLPPPSPENVVWAIRQATATLVDDAAADFPKALALRFLIHFVGDIHQPLHCASRFSKQRPDGDRGGNAFALPSHTVSFAVTCKTRESIPPTTIDELHALWDNTLGLYPALDPANDPPLIACIPQFAEHVTKRVPKRAVPMWTEREPERWARESFRLAKGAYDGIEENALPSRQYLATGQPIVRRRLALGGYRLGALLGCIFSAENERCLGGAAAGSEPVH